MTRIFEDDGRVIPVTLLSCPPCQVVQVKSSDKDGYPAIVLGFDALKKPRKTKKFRVLKEFDLEAGKELKVGDQISVEMLKEVKEVRLTATSKGKGFAGFIKRHHFHSGPGSHGSHFKREPGSIGARSKPGRVMKGKKMAGHMGFDTVTRTHVPVVKVDTEKNLLAVKGPVPGPNGATVIIRY